MAWFYLSLAGVLEVLFTTAMRHANGFTRFWPTVSVLVLAAFSVYFVAKSAETIPLGTAYAVWGALGAAGTVAIGILVYDEPAEPLRLAFLGLLIASIVGLKLVTTS